MQQYVIFNVLKEYCIPKEEEEEEEEEEVIFFSKETPIVSVGLRTSEVSYTNQDKTA
jgi:hypothetical protein